MGQAEDGDVAAAVAAAAVDGKKVKLLHFCKLRRVVSCRVVSCFVLFCLVFFSSALSLLPYAIDLRIASAILQLPHATCHNRQLAIGMRHGCAPIVPSQDSWQRQWHLINASIGLLLLPLPVLLLSPLPAFLTALSLSICLFLRPICSSS